MEFHPGGVYRLKSGSVVLCVYGGPSSMNNDHALYFVKINGEVDAECKAIRSLDCRLDQESALFEHQTHDYEYIAESLAAYFGDPAKKVSSLLHGQRLDHIKPLHAVCKSLQKDGLGEVNSGYLWRSNLIVKGSEPLAEK
jgi:hypothetical protein